MDFSGARGYDTPACGRTSGKGTHVAYVSICAIVKNEGRYIQEWLSYHYAIGIERFVIFHNSSTDDTLAQIAAWPASHLVEVIEWPYDAPQSSAYKEMLKNHRDVSDWCAFIDVDEFITPKGSKSLHEVLRALPDDVGGLYIHWLMFGSAGHTERQPGLVTETFTRRGHSGFAPNRYGKSIVRMSAVTDLLGPHIIGSRLRFVNTEGVDVAQDKGGAQEGVCHTALAIHHYFTKSLEEWRVRRALGRPGLPKGHPDSIRSEAQFASHDVNHVFDDDAARVMQYARTLFYRTEESPAMTQPAEMPLDTRFDAAAVAVQPWLSKSADEQARQTSLQAVLVRKAGASFGAGAYVAPDARVFTQRLVLGARSWIASGAILRGNIEIGADSSVNAYTHIAGNVKIGRGCRIASLSSIYGFDHGIARIDVPIMTQPLTSHGVVLHDDVWVGANVVILDGVEIGAHSVVAAGAVVTKSFPPYVIIGGNPARVLRERTEAEAARPVPQPADAPAPVAPIPVVTDPAPAPAVAAPTQKVRAMLYPSDPYANLEKTFPRDLQGWDSENALFRATLAEVRPSLVVEVGTWKGASAIHMAHICRDLGLAAEIVCIDTWLGNWQHWSRKEGVGSRADLRLVNGFPNLYFQFMSNVLAEKCDDIITPLPLTGVAGAKLFAHYGLKPQVIYIDGDHEYESVISDLNGWLAVLAPGGVLMGDDFSWPGVKRAAFEVVARKKFVLETMGNKFTLRHAPAPAAAPGAAAQPA